MEFPCNLNGVTVALPSKILQSSGVGVHKNSKSTSGPMQEIIRSVIVKRLECEEIQLVN